MAEYGRGSIAARVAKQASQNQNQIVSGGPAPDMSQATTVAPSGGGSILSKLGIGGGDGELSKAREAVASGGTTNVEERNSTFTDKETGEVFDMSQAITGDQASDEQNMIIGQHSNHGMLSNSELQEAGQVAVLDNAGNPLNAITRDVEFKLADGTIKTVEMTSYSDYNQYISDPEKRKDDTDVIDKYVRLFAEGIDAKSQSSTVSKALENTKIATLDQDRFQQLMRTNVQNSNLATAMARTKPKTSTELHETTYEDRSSTDADGKAFGYSDISNTKFNLRGISQSIDSTTRYSDAQSVFKTDDKFRAAAQTSVEESGIAYTGTGYDKFNNLRMTTDTGKEGSISGVPTGRGNGTYGTIMKYAVANDMIENHANTDTSIEGWDKSASYNKKAEFLIENGIINDPGRLQFENREEELEFKASLAAYYDQNVAPQMREIHTAYTKKFGAGYKNQMLNMYKADKALARELYIKKSKLSRVNDISLGTGGPGGAALNNRLQELNTNESFLTSKDATFTGDFGLTYGGYTFDSVLQDINVMHRYVDKADYIQSLADHNVITPEAAETLNDMARFQEINSRGLSEDIDAIESRLGLGEGANQIAKVNKEIKTGGQAFVPVGPTNQHHMSGIQYSKEAGGFVSGGRRTNFNSGLGHGIKSILEEQDKVTVNRANFTTKLNKNYSGLINNDGLSLSKEQYFSILRKKFATEYEESNKFGLDETEYKSMQDLFNDSTDEELVSYSLNIDKATRIPEKGSEPLSILNVTRD
jgi:hypothetical protein